MLLFALELPFNQNNPNSTNGWFPLVLGSNNDSGNTSIAFKHFTDFIPDVRRKNFAIYLPNPILIIDLVAPHFVACHIVSP